MLIILVEDEGEVGIIYVVDFFIYEFGFFLLLYFVEALRCDDDVIPFLLLISLIFDWVVA